MAHVRDFSKTLRENDRCKIIPYENGNEFILIFKSEIFRDCIYISLKEMKNKKIKAKFFYPVEREDYFDSFEHLLNLLYSLEV